MSDFLHNPQFWIKKGVWHRYYGPVAPWSNSWYIHGEQVK